jgi:hypothetical protein
MDLHTSYAKGHQAHSPPHAEAYNPAGYVSTKDKKQNKTSDRPFSPLKEEKGHSLIREGNHLRRVINGDIIKKG